ASGPPSPTALAVTRSRARSSYPPSRFRRASARMPAAVRKIGRAKPNDGRSPAAYASTDGRLWMADEAEAVLLEAAGAVPGSQEVQLVHHVVVTTDERAVDPGRLEDG